MPLGGPARLRRAGLDPERPGGANRAAARRARRELPQPLVDWLIESTEQPVDQQRALRTLTADWTSAQLRSVPELAAAAFVLFHYDKLSMDEVGSALGVTVDQAERCVESVEQRMRFTAFAGTLDRRARRPGRDQTQNS